MAMIGELLNKIGGKTGNLCRLPLLALLLLWGNAWAADGDLYIVSGGTATTYVPGSTVSDYSFIVTNDGPGNLSNIQLNGIALPLGVQSLSWTCSAPGGGNSCDTMVTNNGPVNQTVDLNSGTSATLTLTVTYSAGAVAPIAYSVSVAPGSGNTDTDVTDPPGNTATDTRILRQHDLSVSKTDGSSTYVPGVDHDYTVVVSNDAGSTNAAQGIVVTDTFSSNFTDISWTCSSSAGSSCNGASGTNVTTSPATLGTVDIAVGGSITFTVTGDIPSSATGNLVNTVSVPTASDPDTTDNSATDTDTRAPQTNVSITKDDGVTEYKPGSTTTYSIVVSNSGVSDANGVVVKDFFDVPAAVKDITWTCTPSAGSDCHGAGDSNVSVPNTSPITLGTVDVAAGGTVTFSLTAEFESAATAAVTNTASIDPVAGDTGGTGDDSASDTDTADLESDIAVTIDDSSTTYTPGEATNPNVYTITVENIGPSDATGVVLTSAFPAAQQITWTCATSAASNATCLDGSDLDNTDGTLLNPTVNIVKGETLTYQVTPIFLSSAVLDPMRVVVTAEAATGVDPNEAMPLQNDPDPNNWPVSNNWAYDDDTLARRVDLEVIKTNGFGPDDAGEGTLNPLQAFAYTITITNNGPSDLGAIGSEIGGLLNDVLPGTSVTGHPSPPADCPDNGQPCYLFCNGDAGVQDDYTVGTCPPGAEVAVGSGDIVDENFKLVAGSSTQAEIWVKLTSAATGLGTVSNTAVVAIAVDPNDPPDPNDPNPPPALPNDTQDPDTSNNSEPDTDKVALGTNLVVTKNDSPPATSATPGESHSYSITVRNDLFLDVVGVQVFDSLPLYTSPGNLAGFVPGSGQWTCVAENNACCNSGPSNNCGRTGATAAEMSDALDGTLNNGLIDLPAQSQVTFTFTGDIHPQASGTLSNTASAALPAGVDETNSADNTSTDDDTVLGAKADLVLTKTVTSVTETAPTFHIQYSITVDNLGPSHVSGAQITDSLSDVNLDNATFEWFCEITGSSGASQCAYPDPLNPYASTGASDTLDTLVDLDPGARVTIVLDIDTNTASNPDNKVINTAQVAAPAGVVDSVGSNNSDQVDLVLNGEADLTITKSDGLAVGAFATPGDPLTYEIKVTNAGPDHAFGATVTDILPPELENATWTCDAGTPIPGDLSWVMTDTQQTHLEGAVDVITSPDGHHVYTLGARTEGTGPDLVRYGSLLAYDREEVPNYNFGRLARIDVEQDDVDDASDPGATVDGLAGAAALAISPDGRNIYVIGATDGDDDDEFNPVVAFFTRNTINGSSDFGKLSFAGNVPVGVDAKALALSPDNKHLYVGYAGSIEIFERNPVTGTLSSIEIFTDTVPALPQDMVVSPDGKHLYVSGDDKISAFERDFDDGSPDFGTLAYLDDAVGPGAELDGAGELVISNDGSDLYTVATDAVVRVDRDASDGTIVFGAIYQNADLVNPVPAYGGTLTGANTLAISPDGEHLVVGSGPADAMLVFRRGAGGALDFEQDLGDELPLPPEDGTVNGLDGVNGLAFTSDGRHVLATELVGKSVSVFARRAPDPLFSFIEVEQYNVDDPDPVNADIHIDVHDMVPSLLGASAVAVSPDGGHLYATGLGDSSLTVFVRDEDMGVVEGTRGGHLTLLEVHYDGFEGVSGMDGAGNVLLSPNGRNVYVTSVEGNSIAVFERNVDPVSPNYGALVFIQSLSDSSGGVDGLAGAAGMAMDPDSNHLYVAARYEASVGVFERDSVTGMLSFVQKLTNGVNGVQGLEGATALAISPDGANLVAVGAFKDRLAVFTRETNPSAPVEPGDVAFGELTFLQVRAIGVGDQPLGVAFSPEGSHVYVAAANSDSLSVFRRSDTPGSTDYGRLTFVAQYVDGIDGVSGIRGARAVAVSPDGQRVYVGAESGDAVTVFDRNQSSTSIDFGRLTYLDSRIDGYSGVEGLDGARSIAVSPLGSHVYAAGLSDNAVSAFVRGVGSRCTASGAGNILDNVDVGVGGTLTYIVTSDIIPSALSDVVNNAEVEIPAGFVDATPSDNTITEITPLAPKADLAISKTNSRISSVSGEEVTYEITVTNNGPSNAVHGTPSDVLVTDTLSTDPNFVPGTTGWTCDAVGSGSIDFVGAEFDGVDSVVGLQGATSVALAVDVDGPLDPGPPEVLNPLGEYVYATGVVDNALVVFERDPNSGELTWLQVIRNGDIAGNGVAVQGLNGARAVVVSADGQFIYVASQIDDAVSVFQAVDNGSGALQINYLESHFDGLASQGLNQATALALSPLGDHLYVAGANDNAIAVFTVDGVDGSLIWRQVLQDGDGLIEGIAGITDLVVTPDGGHVYATGANDAALAVFVRDPATGMLSFLESHDQGSSGFDLTGASAVAVANDGEQVYVAAAGSNSVSVFNRDADSLSSGFGQLTAAQHLSESNGTAGLIGVRDILVSTDPEGFHVYAAGQTSDAIVFFNRDLGDGTLTAIGARSDGAGSVDGLDGIGGLAMSLDGRFLYGAAALDSAISVFERTADSICPASGVGDLNAPVSIAAGGTLVFTLTATVSPDATGELHNTATVTALIDDHPDNQANDTSEDVDQLNPTADLGITKTDGLAEYDGLRGATAVAVSPGAGTHLYVAGREDNAIAVIEREEQSIPLADFGRLTYLGKHRNGEDGVDGLAGVEDILVSPDGLNVYAVGSIDNALAVFQRDDESGLLTFIERQKQNLLGVNGLSGPSAVAISPDGEHVYATGRNTDSLVVFTRDSETPGSAGYGGLTYSQSLQNGVNSISGIAGPTDIAVSPDGKHVYVLSKNENAIAVFLRNTDSGSAAFGQLTFHTSYSDSDGFGGMLEPEALMLTKSGLFIYVAGTGDDSVVVLQRNPANGELYYVEHKQNGTGGVTSMTEPSGIALSPDGTSLYVANRASHAVVRFTREKLSGSLAFDDAIVNGEATGAPGEFVQGLGGAADLVVSPDDEHVYVAAGSGHALTALDRDTVTELGDLSFLETMIDGLGGVAPGDMVEYQIIVTNAGPSNVTGARVQDEFPSAFESISWTCSAEIAPGNPLPPDPKSSNCVGLGSGSIDTPVNINVGDRLLFTAGGQVRTGVSGYLVNTATVTVPAGYSDPVPGNDSDTDDDTILTPAADLQIVKDNGTAVLVPGEPVSYTITAYNAGPSYVPGAMVTDVVPEAITDVNWSCVATPEPGLLELVDIYSAELDNFQQAAVSPDGLFVYTVGSQGGVGKIVLYGRDTRAGDLLPIAAYANDDPAIDGLGGATALVISDDGQHVYVASELDDAVAVFERDTVTGELSFVEMQQDNAGTVNGLGGARALRLSPDNRHLYVAGYLDDAIAVFARNSATGALTFVEAVVNGQGGVDGLNGATDLVFSTDGMHFYVAGSENDAIAAFTRNSGDGTLGYVNSIYNFQLFDGQGLPVDALTEPAGLAISASGDRLYATGYGSDAVGIFERDSATGELSFVGALIQGAGATDLNGPSGLVLSPDGAELYVAATLSNAVSMLRVGEDSLQQLAVYDTGFSSGLAGVDSLAMSADGAHLYSGGRSASSLTAMERQPGARCTASGSGNLTDMVDISVGGQVQYTVTGQVIPSATGQVNNLAAVIEPFPLQEREPGDNQDVDSDPLEGQSDLAATKTDNLTEVIAGLSLTYDIMVSNLAGSDAAGAELVDLLPIFMPPTVTAGLVEDSVSMQCQSTVPLAFQTEYDTVLAPELAGSNQVVSSADGRFLYITGPVTGSLMVWERDTAGPVHGALTLVQTLSNGEVLTGGTVAGLAGASGLSLSPDGQHLYVAGYDDNSLAVYTRDETTGMLDWVQLHVNGDEMSGMEGPLGVTVSPDGNNVYVASELPSDSLASGAVAIFQRDPASGELAFVERVKDGFGTIVPDFDVMVGSRQVLVTPDGRHAYVVGTQSNALAMFDRDPNSGVLSYTGVVRNGDLHGLETVSGLNLVFAATMSPNGTHIYAAGLGDDRVAVFERDIQSGALTFLEAHNDGVNGVSGLDGVNTVTLSPDGAYLFAAGINSDAVAVFARDWFSGELDYRYTINNGDDGMSTLDQPGGLLVSADGANLYALARNPGSIVLIDRVPEGVCGADNSQPGVIAVELDLVSGASVALTVSATVDPSARGVLQNTASTLVPLDWNDPDLGNNDGTDLTTIIVESDIAVTKTGPVDPVAAGTDFDYTIEVTNAGPSSALGMRVQDTLPPGLLGADWVCVASAGSTCGAGGSGDLDDLADLLPDGTLTYTITAHTDPGWVGAVNNTASLVVEPGSTDPDLTNNSSSITTQLISVPDVAVSKWTQQQILVPGKTVDYQVRVTNSGPSHAAQVLISDVMPAGLDSVNWSCDAASGAICGSPAGTGDLAELIAIDVGSQVDFFINATIDPALPPGQMTNMVEALVQAGASDPDLTNNTASETTPLVPESDLSISKTDSPDPFDPNGAVPLLRYTVNVANAGTSVAWNTRLTDVLPSVVTLDNTSNCLTSQIVDVPTNTMECTLGDLQPGESVQVLIDVSVDPAASGFIVNESFVESDSFDPLPSNNWTLAQTQLQQSGASDITLVTKTNGVDVVTPGQDVVYTILVTNLGSDNVVQLSVVDVMPPELTNVSWTCSATPGAACTAAGTGDIADAGASIPRGGWLVYLVSATVDPLLDPDLVGTITNTVTASYDGSDANTSNNVSSDTDVLLDWDFADEYEN